MFNGYKFFPYGYRFIELFSKNSKEVSIILNKIFFDLQFTLSHKDSVVLDYSTLITVLCSTWYSTTVILYYSVTWFKFIYSFNMFNILVYSLNLFKFLWKKIIIIVLNTKYQKYRVRFIRPLLKKSNKCYRKATFHSPTLLYYSCYQTFNNLSVTSATNSK